MDFENQGINKPVNETPENIDTLKAEVHQEAKEVPAEKRSRIEKFLDNPLATTGEAVASLFASRWPKLALKILLITAAGITVEQLAESSMKNFIEDNKPYVEKMQQDALQKQKEAENIRETMHKADSTITANTQKLHSDKTGDVENPEAGK